mgnify:CR=1 FL=1
MTAILENIPYKILNKKTSPNELGRHFGAYLYEAEVEYLKQHEWALQSDDILWRRSKLGLHTSSKTQEAIARYLEERGDTHEQRSATSH